MAHHKRKHSRTYPRTHRTNKRLTLRYYYWMGNRPKWWDVIFHTRPGRIRARATTSKLMRDPGLWDDTAYYDVGKKPHKYYW